jgi:hypothetical protein
MPETKEWTLMFYFASDNSLAPEIVSQLKAIKNAGYHHEVNVVAYFDPQPPGTPAHIFDVNGINKLKRPHDNDIGFASDDPFIRNLIEDRLWGNEKDRNGQPIRRLLVKRYEDEGITYSLPPVTTDRGNIRDTEKSLESFLDFCAYAYPAKHYMLFILGHGLVVGDDIFLFDEHTARQSVTLRKLGDALTDFKTKIGTAEFELVSFHSCSMSSLEVAFQLQDTANYMLASQGPAFVGSWPYRQILIRVFKDVAESKLKPEEIKETLEKIFDYVYHNSTDYLLAGYSFDLCLCELNESKINALKEPIDNLCDALIDGLKDETKLLVNFSMLLAHWKSQSYYQENYTDLFDFCHCLKGYCNDIAKAANATNGASGADTTEAANTANKPNHFQRVQAACQAVMDGLTQASLRLPDNPVIRAKFAGPDSQYSHGFSIFFPWARPSADRKIMKEYEQYNFNQTKWLTFLNQYWGPQTHKDEVKGSTMRDSHKFEADMQRVAEGLGLKNESKNDMLDEDIASLMFNAEAVQKNRIRKVQRATPAPVGL